MSRSFLQPSPSKKTGEQSSVQQPQLKASRNNMSNYTQIIIETYDQEVPYVSIFKPNIKRQQRRIQAILGIQRILKKAEMIRVSFAFTKLALLKYMQNQYLSKTINLEYTLQKMVKKRLSKSFFHVLSNKVKKNNILVAAKMLNLFSSSYRTNNFRHSFNKLKSHYYKNLVLKLQNESSISAQLQLIKKELFTQKQGNFSTEIINKCKTNIKMTNGQTFINSIEENNLHQQIKLQLSRFENQRQIILPKRKQLFQNQIVANLLNNIMRAYKEIINGHIEKENQLQAKIQGYTNAEGIQQLRILLSEKQSFLSTIQSWCSQIFRFDSQLKRNQKSSFQKLFSLFSAHQKRMQTKTHQQNSLPAKIWNSRLFIHNFITNIVKKLCDQKQNIMKNINQLVEDMNQQDKLATYIRKTRQNSSLKLLAQFILDIHQKLNYLLNQTQQLKRNNQVQNQSINTLIDFIKQSQHKINNQEQIELSINNQISINLIPIQQTYISILKTNAHLLSQNKRLQNQIEQCKNRDYIPYSQVKPIGQLIITPQKNKIEQRQSQLSQFANHFLSPLKEAVQNRKQDTQLKIIMIRCEQKIQQIIDQNRLLQEKLRNLQANDEIIQQLTLNKAQYQQKIRQFERQRAQMCSEISNYQFKIRQLTYNNGELIEQVHSLKQSFNQFNNIANSNNDLSQKINEMYQKSMLQNRQQQQLMKQTELMRQIINHKIQFENMTMNHFKQIQSLRNQINSYKTIITKLQNDLIHKQSHTAHLQSTFKSISSKYQEIKETNIELKQKIEHIVKVKNVQITNKFKEDQSQLTKLKNQCNSIYLQLQRSAQNLNNKNYQLQNQEFRLKEQEQIILALKEQKSKLTVDFQDLLVQYSTSEQQIAKYKVQINQIKSQYNSIQLQFNKNQASYSHVSQNYLIIQKQLHQKQIAINNLIEQAKFSNSSFASQLLQARQQYSNMQKLLQQRISQKDVRYSRLQFQFNQKRNIINSLQQLISIYSSNEEQLKKQNETMKNQHSRDKQIQYLCEQIKSLEQFVSDITLQYHQLQLRYQQERERTNRSFTSYTPQKHSEIHHYRQSFSEQVKSHHRFENNSPKNSNILQNENDVSMQLEKLLANNENLSYSVDFLREENKELFMKVKNISSPELIIQLVYGILLNISKFKSESEDAAKLWEDLCHLRAQHSGNNLFANLQLFCSNFIQRYSRK